VGQGEFLKEKCQYKIMFSLCHLSVPRLIKYCSSTKAQLVHIFHKVNQLNTHKQTNQAQREHHANGGCYEQTHAIFSTILSKYYLPWKTTSQQQRKGNGNCIIYHHLIRSGYRQYTDHPIQHAPHTAAVTTAFSHTKAASAWNLKFTVNLQIKLNYFIKQS